MSKLDAKLLNRANHKCELCSSEQNLVQFKVENTGFDQFENEVIICSNCEEQINEVVPVDENHWRLLNDSIWHPVIAIQVLSYRLLHQFNQFSWTRDLIEMMYMEEEVKNWADSGLIKTPQIVHKDCNGNVLKKGDSVVLIKDLDVKGTSFVAKRGTAVHNINLDHENENHIEGRVNSQYIVILTQYVKKTK